LTIPAIVIQKRGALSFPVVTTSLPLKKVQSHWIDTLGPAGPQAENFGGVVWQRDFLHSRLLTAAARRTTI